MASSDKAEDRRIAKTQASLRDALIDLMEKRGYDELTVNDICDAADITRATFYNHYHDKDELLYSLEDEIFDGVAGFRDKAEKLNPISVVTKVKRGKPLPLLVELFDYLREQGDFLHAVLGEGGDASFSPALRDFVCNDLVEGMLHERYRNSDDPFVGYYIAFFSSAYMGVIERWVQGGMKEDSEYMARVAMRLLFIKPGESIKL